MLSTMRACLVGIEHRSFQSRTNRETGEVKPASDSYRVFLSADFNSAPVMCFADAQVYAAAQLLGQGATVDALCESRGAARSYEMTVVLKGLTAVSDNGRVGASK